MENTNQQAMEIDISSEQFGCTVYQWHELPSEKLDLQQLETFLNTRLNLFDYGNGLSELVFGFIAYPKRLKENALDCVEREFLPDRKLASIGWIIDYEKLMTATKVEAFEILKHTYLEGIKVVLPTLVTTDFEVTKFCEALEQVLFECQ